MSIETVDKLADEVYELKMKNLSLQKEVDELNRLLSHYEDVNSKLRRCQYLLGQINSLSDLSKE